MPMAGQIAGMEFTPYTGERVAGMTGLQEQALAGYGALGAPEQFGQAGSVFQEIAGMQARTPEQRAADVARYTQEYTAGVMDPTIAAMEAQRAKQRTAEAATRAKAGAFGSRGDVYRGALEGEYQVGMGQTLGQLQQQGYTQAVARQQAEDAARRAEQAQRLGAAGQLAGLGATQFQTQLAGLGAQMGAGEAQRLLSQQGLDAAYQEYLAQQQFPLSQFAALTGGAGAFPAGLGTTTGTTSTRDPMGSIGSLMAGAGSLGQGFGAMFGGGAGAAGAGAGASGAGSAMATFLSMFSDIRLKENVQPHSTSNGVNFYTWDWNDIAKDKGLDGSSFGVIAQELEETHPHLVVRSDDGYRMVDYGGLYQEIGA